MSNIIRRQLVHTKRRNKIVYQSPHLNSVSLENSQTYVKQTTFHFRSRHEMLRMQEKMEKIGTSLTCETEIDPFQRCTEEIREKVCLGGRGLQP